MANPHHGQNGAGSGNSVAMVARKAGLGEAPSRNFSNCKVGEAFRDWFPSRLE